MPVRHAAGFSLVEAVVAVAILLLLCLAVTGMLLTAIHGSRMLERRALLEELVESESVRLAALPYCALSAPPQEGLRWHATPTSLLGEVLPHTLSERNIAAAGWLDDAAIFVTRRDVGTATLECTAEFVRRRGGEWQKADRAACAGWAVWRPAVMPTTTVEAVITATEGGSSVSRRLRLTALRPVMSAAAEPVRSDHAH